MEPVSTRNICDPDTAGLANELLAQVIALLARPEWFAGFGLPLDTIGKDGDFYVDRATGNVYEKENGTWV